MDKIKEALLQADRVYRIVVVDVLRSYPVISTRSTR